MSRKTRTRITEELNFDVGDGALKLRIFEKQYTSLDLPAVDYRLESQISSHGQYMVSSIPIGSAQMARRLSEVLARTADRMEAEGAPLVGGKHPTFKQKQAPRHVVSIRDGLKSRSVFERTRITSTSDQAAYFVGRDWIDKKGDVIHFEAMPQTRAHGKGGSLTYHEAEIGMTLKEARAYRKANGLEPCITLFEHPHQIDVTGFSHRYVEIGADPAIFDPDEDPADLFLEAIETSKEAPGREWGRGDYRPMTDDEWEKFSRGQIVSSVRYVISAYRWTKAGTNPAKLAKFILAVQKAFGVADDIIKDANDTMYGGPEVLFKED